MLHVPPALFPRVIGSTPNHLYLAPHPLLGAYIAHYTLCFPARVPAQSLFESGLSLLPDASGCLIFSLHPNHVSGLFLGPSTKIVVVHDDFRENPLRIFVEFLPGGAHRFCGLRQRELADTRLPVEEIFPMLLRQLEAMAERGESLQTFIVALDHLFLRMLECERPQLAGAVASRLCRDRIFSVEEAARQAAYSPRHLNRLFEESLGLSVKSFLRLTRVNHAVRLIKGQAARPGGQARGALTRISQELGYFDQAHFIHDFRAVCGLSPTAFLRDMSGFYNESFKF